MGVWNIVCAVWGNFEALAGAQTLSLLARSVTLKVERVDWRRDVETEMLKGEKGGREGEGEKEKN